MDSSFPLSLVWQASLAAPGSPSLRPLVADDTVVWRSGPVVAGFAATDGAARWHHDLRPHARSGAVLVRSGALTVTDGWDRDASLASLVAFDERGAVAWNVTTDGAIGRGGLIAEGPHLLAILSRPRRGAWLLTLDAATGATVARRELPQVGTALTRVPGGLLVRDTTAERDRTGLYRLDDDGAMRELAHGACGLAARVGDRLVIQQLLEDRVEVVGRDLASLEVVWRAEVAAPAADADGEDVAGIERDGDHLALVVRAAASGAVRWRSDTRAAERIDTVAFAGPVVAVASLDGWAYFRRDDGAWLGRIEEELGPPAAGGGRVYIGGSGRLLAATI